MAKKRVRHHVNPLADLTEHHFDGFDNNQPIIIDIGADRGEFVMQLVEKYGATKNFIVCEIRKPLARRLEKKFATYDNVIIFDGDIVRNFAQIVRPSLDRGVNIEEIYINFPDPWFKERHKKRRVVTEKFILDIRPWISSYTRWIFQTDQKDLFEQTQEILHNISGIVVELFDQSPHGATTKWENAKKLQGSDIYRLSFYIT